MTKNKRNDKKTLLDMVKAESELEKSKLLLHEYEAEEGITPAFGPLLMG